MVDAALSALWVAILVGGLALAGGLARLGLSRTHVRDVLHVGAGVWPLGWAAWHGPDAPLAIVWGALLGMAALPAVARRAPLAARLVDAVCGEDERFSGLVLYTLSVAVFTTVGLWKAPFAAAAALLALALGDGVGGAVGLGFGRHCFRVPGGKQKSLEGSLAVALFSTLGVALAAHWFSVALSFPLAALAGGVAALAEAASPRATDNVFLPLSVFSVLALGAGVR